MIMGNIRGWAAHGPRQKLEPFCYDAGPLGAEEVEVAVEYCGLCHSDLSIINNDWGVSRYPAVPGHEAVGTVVSAGPGVRGVKVGQRVGVGWNVECCMHCRECLTGNHHLCLQVMPTIIGHYGAFAERVRSHWLWAIPLPEKLESASAGPLLCGGITVFAPLITYGIKPPARVRDRRHRRLGPYGSSIPRCLGVRSDRLYLQSVQDERAVEAGRRSHRIHSGQLRNRQGCQHARFSARYRECSARLDCFFAYAQAQRSYACCWRGT